MGTPAAEGASLTLSGGLVELLRRQGSLHIPTQELHPVRRRVIYVVALLEHRTLTISLSLTIILTLSNHIIFTPIYSEIYI